MSPSTGGCARVSLVIVVLACVFSMVATANWMCFTLGWKPNTSGIAISLLGKAIFAHDTPSYFEQRTGYRAKWLSRKIREEAPRHVFFAIAGLTGASLLHAAIVRRSTRDRIRHGHCAHCDYLLLSAQVSCPECGRNRQLN